MGFSRIANIVILLSVFSAIVSGKGHHYQQNDNVPLFVNKIGPYSNPSETYRFYDVIKFCHPKEGAEKPHQHRSNFGEKLTGNKNFESAYEINFKGETFSQPALISSSYFPHNDGNIDLFYRGEECEIMSVVFVH